KPWMHEQIKNPTGADIATGFAVFCGALIFLIPLGIYLASLIKGRALTAIDRSLGFVFGLLRGVVIVCLLYVVTLWVWPTHDKEPAWLAGARTRPVMVYGASMIESWVPRSDLDKAADTVLGRNDGAADINPKSSDGSPAAPSTDGKPAASPATPPGDKPAAYNQQSRSDLNRLIAQPQPQQQPPQQPPQPQPPGRAP
ncbi:MAG TPA: CvpA family protein, partial [Alphaproteobacteria bacterium]|nr:CvpA family protein [Alphaproteobacteria bacterium]